MKFLLVPLLIIGMFASFIAALMAMLFFTGTVQTPQQLQKLLTESGPDSTHVVEEFTSRSDELDKLIETATQYDSTYEAETKRARDLQDSLLAEQLKITTISDSLKLKNQLLGKDVDSTLKIRQTENLKNLAALFTKLKPAAAAEILQQGGGLSDTTAAQLLKQIPPAQVAKIMANMEPPFAARIAKLMQDL